MEQKYYKCTRCGNIVEMVEDKGTLIMCCGQNMEQIIPGTTDAALEKHIPVIKTEGNQITVMVGEVTHPMLEEHYIEWITIQTDKGEQRKMLSPGEEPKAVFYVENDETVESAYAYCNIHSLWKKDA